eukprot:scaffold23669_cov132-Cylindrotheca_fusiformis.AAC.1
MVSGMAFEKSIYLLYILAPIGRDGLIVVLESACPSIFQIQSGASSPIKWPKTPFPWERQTGMIPSMTTWVSSKHESPLPKGSCIPVITLHVYPSAEF